MKRILTGAVLALLLAAVVQGQATLTGKWQGETKNGSQVVFDATVIKTELTGTLTVDGEPNAISGGKVLKNTFSFVARAEAFAGEFAGDQVKIWMERRGPDSAAILKRMKTDKK